MQGISLRQIALTGLAACAILLTGCASAPKQDLSAFRQAKPASILVLPPLNESPDVNATSSMLSQVTFPLAEAGYYVLPVSLVTETFRNNGMQMPGEMHQAPVQKLKEIFGADAALYIKVTRYGNTYAILNSVAIVSAEARLINLSNGQLLWEGKASASNDSGNNNQGGGLAGLLVAAIVKQILHEAVDASHPVAGMAAVQLLSADGPNGMLYGPRSPMYGKETVK